MSDLFDDPRDGEKFTAARNADAAEALIVDLGGWEGPLHLLLALVRKNKVDLAMMPMADLADQYLVFIHEARSQRLDIAAEYLVMAAWLTYLKTRLLLPGSLSEEDGPEPEDMAAALAFRLKRLDAMRAAADALMARAVCGRDVFTRRRPEGVRSVRTPVYEAELHDLLKAYAVRRERRAFTTYQPGSSNVYGLEKARLRLTAITRRLTGWERLDRLLPSEEELGHDAPGTDSVLASSLVAALEITRNGEVHIRQDETYGPIWLRKTSGADEEGG